MRAERTRVTKAALLAAGRQLFAEKGYAGAGREEIVALAGVTRGALYHHFGDKLGLFQAVLEEVEAELTDAVAAAADLPGVDAREMLVSGAMRFIDASMEATCRRIILDAPAVLGWTESRRIQEDHSLGLTKRALRIAMESGAFETEPVDPLAAILLAALHEAATLIAQSDDPAGARLEVGQSVERLLRRL
jgi:AcrR family transcriptional regulator